MHGLSAFRVRGRQLPVRRVLAFGLLFAFVAAGSLVGLLQETGEGALTGASIGEWVKDLGFWGHLAIVALMILQSFVPFPAELVAFAAGMWFGPVVGMISVWIGAMLGAAVAFGLSRGLGRPFVEGVLSESQAEKLNRWSKEHSVRTLIVVRLIPVIAFNLINYAAGLTRVRWWTFLWTTGLGIVPLTGVMVYMGHEMRQLSWLHLVYGTGFGLFALLAWYLCSKRRSAAGDLGGNS